MMSRMFLSGDLNIRELSCKFMFRGGSMKKIGVAGVNLGWHFAFFIYNDNVMTVNLLQYGGFNAEHILQILEKISSKEQVYPPRRQYRSFVDFDSPGFRLRQPAAAREASNHENK